MVAPDGLRELPRTDHANVRDNIFLLHSGQWLPLKSQCGSEARQPLRRLPKPNIVLLVDLNSSAVEKCSQQQESSGSHVWTTTYVENPNFAGSCLDPPLLPMNGQITDILPRNLSSRIFLNNTTPTIRLSQVILHLASDAGRGNDMVRMVRP